MPEIMTHAFLVERAVAWLQNVQNCTTVITQKSIVNCEEPDAIGWTAQGHSYLIEAKVSHKDFYRDLEKNWRKHPRLGMGQYRLYLAPPGVISAFRVPDNWGLIEALPRRRFGVILPGNRFDEYNVRAEMKHLLAHVRRLEGKVKPIPPAKAKRMSPEPRHQKPKAVFPPKKDDELHVPEYVLDRS